MEKGGSSPSGPSPLFLQTGKAISKLSLFPFAFKSFCPLISDINDVAEALKKELLNNQLSVSGRFIIVGLESFLQHDYLFQDLWVIEASLLAIGIELNSKLIPVF